MIAPDLKVARSYHSACSFEYKAYVFCGTGKRLKLNSIEVFDTKADCGSLQWRLIDIPEASMSARTNPVVIAANSEELMIMGGYNNAYFGDINVFNTSTETVKLEKTLNEGFSAIGNQCGRTSGGRFVALTGGDQRRLMSYQRGSDQIVTITKLVIEI